MNESIENFADSLHQSRKKVIIDSHGKPITLPVIGDIVGNVRIESKLGQGAMGVVYKGAVIGFDIERAIKFPSNDSTMSDLERFRNEVKICSNLEHKNIVRVFNTGYWKDNLPFTEMEFINGQNIEQIKNYEKRFPPTFAMAVMSIVCSALQYAYGQTITIDGKRSRMLVHRDIKPSNIMITTKGVVKVMDFGLAKFESKKFTSNSGPILGTVHYMAPELQSHNHATVKTDIYAIGVTLYEMIAGVKPFTYSKFEELDKMVELKYAGKYTPIEEYIPGIDPEISVIIDKCISSDPDKRYPTFGELRYYLDCQIDNYTRISAKDIVSLFMLNRNAFTVAVRTTPQKQSGFKKSIKNNIFAIVASTLSIVALLSCFLLTYKYMTFRNNHSIKYVSVPDKKTSAEKAVPPVVSCRQNIEPQIIQTTALESKNIDNSENKKSSQNYRKIKTNQSMQSNRDQTQSAHQTSPFQKAFTFYNSSDYRSAIGQFKAIDLLSQPQEKQDSIVIYLMESCYKIKDLQQALTISYAHYVNDGKYFFIVALCQVPLGMHSESFNAFEKMMAAPFKIDPDSRTKALLQRARYYQRRSDNLNTNEWGNRAKSAWRDFMKSECADDTPECEEAKSKAGEE